MKDFWLAAIDVPLPPIPTGQGGGAARAGRSRRAGAGSAARSGGPRTSRRTGSPGAHRPGRVTCHPAPSPRPTRGPPEPFRLGYARRPVEVLCLRDAALGPHLSQVPDDLG